MRFINYFSVMILFVICMACKDTETGPDGFETSWNYLGLGQYNVEEIKIVDDMLFAATRQGMFKKSVNSADTLWQHAGLEGMEITDFVVYSVNELLASTKVSGSQSISFYKTNDGGVNWEPLNSNFGGAQGTQTCQALEKAPAEEDVLYARGIINVAKSTDGGITWESTFQDWNNIGYQADLIVVDENDPDIVWAGGENSIFSPYLIKSIDKGETWLPQEIPSEGDNAVYAMAIHPDNSDRVLVGMEAQIISTSDGGENWDVNFTPSESSYVLDIQNSSIQNAKVYATGTDGGTSLGDVILFISEDFGENWKTVKHAGKAGVQYGAQDMAILDSEGTALVYIGTNRGVFVYREE